MRARTARDPYLDLPLDGLRLIEASAGTGKTFTLATLVTRLVVERGLRVGQVLTVTFTEAATQELRHRIRARLESTLQLLDGDVGTARDDDSAEDCIGREILVAHLAAGTESAEALRRRLQQAVHEIDLAAIFTIHGFCSRALSEHALESGQGFDPPEQLTSDKALRTDLAADLWRAFAADPVDAALLTDLWSSPDALADDLRALLGDAPLLPGPPADTPDPLPAFQSAFAVLRVAFTADDHAFLDAMRAALDGEVLNKSGYQKTLLGDVWSALADYCAQDDATGPVDERIERLGPVYIEGKLRKGRENEAPRSPLSDAIASWIDAREQREAWRIERRIALLHHIRDAARLRIDSLKRQRRVRTYDDLISNLADALDGPHGGVLAQRLRAQYAIALVDEFQDTDARQWSIFQRVFGVLGDEGRAPALFLIGDPKQAIYGFRGGDVQTYLAAKQQAEQAPSLAQNFRSRPSVLDAIAALYGNARRNEDTPFVVEGIDFHEVEPGGRRDDGNFLRDGQPAPAMTVCRFADVFDRKTGKPTQFKAEKSRELATAACVAAIHGVLSDAREGRATLQDKHGIAQPVRPGDIAVLVRSHKDATRIQHALAAVGIAAVAAGKQSLFSTDEARELRSLFEALLQPADDGRLRAALATVLLGCDAADIAALDTDLIGHARWQHAALMWRERWQRSGPLALVADLCAMHAPRLLGLLDGERRLTNLMQLGELLQEADVRALGLHGLVDWLRGRIADADSDDESQLLRLESDARRVQIVTLHKSKGLEYPLVYLPFIGIGGKPPSTERHCIVQSADVQSADGNRRVLHWKIDKESDDWKDAHERAQQAQEAEDARLLYVGLTRAQDALWLVSGPFRDADKTRVWPMLKDLAATTDMPGIVFTDGDHLPSLHHLPDDDDISVPPARVAQRVLSRDWWVHSFSQLTRADGGEADSPASAVIDERGANDEPTVIMEAEPPVSATTAANTGNDVDDFADDRRFGGTVFGNALHEALENVDFAAWQHWNGGLAPSGQDGPLRDALAQGGFADADIDDGVTLLARLIGHTLTVPLPEGGRLADTPAGQRRAEMEFHFAMQPTGVEALFELLHRHDVVPRRHAFGLRRRLDGLMTGKIDLTYIADDRWYVLDYKSNRLPAYDQASLDAAMQHSEYDLQALIYTLALHRWLRFRLGDGYDYARDFGGIRYLFCRGLHEGNGHGIHAQRFTTELVLELDELFGKGSTMSRECGMDAGAVTHTGPQA